jgi:hypothetical protein
MDPDQYDFVISVSGKGRKGGMNRGRGKVPQEGCPGWRTELGEGDGG